MVAPSSTSMTSIAPAPGASVAAGGSVAAGDSVAGASVAGDSVAGISVGGTVVAAGASVAAGPQAVSANATTSRTLNSANSFLFILLLSLRFACFSYLQIYLSRSIKILRNHLLCEYV